MCTHYHVTLKGRETLASAEVDALLTYTVAADPGATRDGLLSQTQQLLADSVPYVPLVGTVLPWVYNGDYVGLNPNPTGAVYIQDVVSP
jgi:ABC-type transport system substrate-binding protein